MSKFIPSLVPTSKRRKIRIPAIKVSGTNNGVKIPLDITDPEIFTELAFSPNAYSPAAWIDASDESTVTVDTGVSVILDKSSNSNNCSQGVASKQPLYIQNEWNDLSVMRFDGSDDGLDFLTQPLTGGVGRTVFAVARCRVAESLTGNAVFAATTYYSSPEAGSNWDFCLEDDRIVIRVSGNKEFNANTPCSTTDFEIYSGQNPLGGDCNSMTAYQNGYELTQAAVSNQTVNTRTSVANIGGECNQTVRWFDGDIGEIIVFDRELTDSERELIEGYLADKWGLLDKLPTGHPYKTGFSGGASLHRNIAVEFPEGVQLPVEVTDKEWDSNNNKAVIYVSLDGVTDVEDNDIIFYYDKDQPPNTDYVGLLDDSMAAGEVLFTKVTSGDGSVSSAQYNRRLVIEKETLTAFSTKTIVEFFQRSGQTYEITEAWIGQIDPADGAYIFDGNQVQITKGGLTTFTITDGDALSDEIDFAIDGTHDICVSMWCENDTSTRAMMTVPSGWRMYYDSTPGGPNTAGDSDPTSKMTVTTNRLEVFEGLYAPAEGNIASQVWGADYAAVYHFADDPLTDSLRDSSQYQNTGTPEAGFDSADLVDGQLGKAWFFDGDTYAINIPHNDIFNSDDLTVEVFFRSNEATFPDSRGLLLKSPDTGPSREISLVLASDEVISSMVSNAAGSASTTVPGVTDVSDDAWHWATFQKEHITDNDTLRTLLNGVLEAESSTGSDSFQGTNEINIGKVSSTSVASQYMHGWISEVRISRKVVPAEVQQLVALAYAGNLYTWEAYIEEPQSPIAYQFQFNTPAKTETLVHFPVSLVFSAESSLSAYDTSAVFDELDVSFDKLIIKQDGEQLYGEVIKWDTANKIGVVIVAATVSPTPVPIVVNYNPDNAVQPNYIQSTAQLVRRSCFHDILIPDANNRTANYSRRTIIPKEMIQATGNKFRIRMMYNGKQIDVTELWIGKRNPGSDYDFYGDQVQVLFAGGASVSVTEDNIYSDWIEYDINGTEDIIISGYHTSEGSSAPQYDVNSGTWYSTSANEAGETYPSPGYIWGATQLHWASAIEFEKSVGQAVWDDGFKLVAHYNQDPTFIDMVDSTGLWAGQAVNFVSDKRVDAPAGYMIQHDGVNQFVRWRGNSDDHESGPHAYLAKFGTWEFFHVNTRYDSRNNLMGAWTATPSNPTVGWYFDAVYSDTQYCRIYNITQGEIAFTDDNPYNSKHQLSSITWNSLTTVHTFNVDGAFVVDGAAGPPNHEIHSKQWPDIGGHGSTTPAYAGSIGEFRISNVVRTLVWQQCTFLTLNDSLGYWTLSDIGDETFEFDVKIPAQPVMMEDVPVIVRIGSDVGVTGYDNTDVFSAGLPNMIDSATVLLVESDNSDGETTFVDQGPNGLALTPAGSAEHSADYPINAHSSMKLLTGARVVSETTDLGNIGTQDLTIRAKIRPITLGGVILSFFASSTERFHFQTGVSGELSLWFSNVGGYTGNTDCPVKTGMINDVEMCITGGNIYFFNNGVPCGVVPFSGSLGGLAGQFAIGSRYTTSWAVDLNGYVQAVEVIVGRALHTTVFSPPICNPSNPDYRRLTFKKGKVEDLSTEVEIWEPWHVSLANQQALFICKTDLSSEEETVITVNYNPENDLNLSWVDRILSNAAKLAWNSNIQGRYGLNQGPGGSDKPILDSTPQISHLYSSGSMNDDDIVPFVAMGQATQFDGTNDIMLASQPYWDAEQITVIASFTLDQLPATDNTSKRFVTKAASSPADGDWVLDVRNEGGGNFAFRFFVWINSAWVTASITMAIATDTQYVLQGVSDGTDVLIYVDGQLQNSVPGGLIGSGSVRALRIGEDANTNGEFFAGKMAEVQVWKTGLDAYWADVLYQILSDKLATYVPGDGQDTPPVILYPRLQWWDEMYALLWPRIQYWDEIYGIQLQAVFDMYYGDSPLLLQWWNEEYGDVNQLLRWWDMKYGDRRGLIQWWDLPYSIRAGLIQWWDEVYTVAEKPIQNWWDLKYGLNQYNSIQQWWDEVYSIIADSFVEESDLEIYLDDTRVYPFHVNQEVNRNSYKAFAEIQLADQESYLIAEANVTVLRIKDDTDDWYYQIGIPVEHASIGSTTYIVQAESKSRVLERAEAISREEAYSGFASAVVAELAALHNITVSWEIPDWLLPDDELYANDRTPLNIIKQITGAAGALLQPTPEGNLRVVANMESNSNKWDEDTPSYYLTDQKNFFSTGENADERPGYNKYRISDYTEDDENTDLKEDELTASKKLLKAYRIPFDNKQLTLYTSDSNATIVYNGIVTEYITEEVEIVSGECSVNLPIYEKPAKPVYDDTDLGEVDTYTEEGTINVTTPGQSLATIKYLTKYHKWTATDYDEENTQFWVE